MKPSPWPDGQRTPPPSLTSSEVAAIMSVTQKTVVRWANSGKLPCFKTLGGHRRFFKTDIDKILRGRS